MKISVVIPAYNSSRTIQRAVGSVLRQSRPADEIIVVDDGSRDNTAEAVKSMGLSVRLIVQPNGGTSTARNAGIQSAQGDWIAFLDADDEWLPDKLAVQAAWFETHPDMVWGYGNFVGDNGHGNISGPVLPPLSCSDTVFEDYLDAYHRGYFAWTSSLMVRRDVFSKTGLFLIGMKRGQDTDMWFRIAYVFPRVGYIGRKLAIYHQDTPGSSTKKNVHYHFMMDLLDRHLELSRQLNRQQAFAPCASAMLETWIRQLFSDSQKKEVKDLRSRYRCYLSDRFIRELQVRLLVPRCALPLIDAYFNIKNRLKRKV